MDELNFTKGLVCCAPDVNVLYFYYTCQGHSIALRTVS